MKNIHLLPTENYKEDYKLQNSDAVIQVVKLGQLIFDSSLKEFRINKNPSWAASCDTDVLIPHNIYITSDEEIKEGDWYLNNEHLLKCTELKIRSACKKIILTTDQDLIKDGVQAIDDEFLEWFVKNPSCEFVEVKNGVKRLNSDGEEIGFPDMSSYKIIIPKEEPKQETLEEAAEKWLNKDGFNVYNHYDTRPSFIAGSKWQQERMFSEEEVIKILIEYDYSKINYDKLNSVGTIKKWFEQFKKK